MKILAARLDIADVDHHRLDDHRRQVPGIRLDHGDRMFDVVEREDRCTFHPARVKSRGPGHRGHRAHRAAGLGRVVEDAYEHRVRPTVVAPLNLGDPIPPGGSPCDLKGVKCRFGPRIGEANHVDRRDDLEEQLGQFDHSLPFHTDRQPRLEGFANRGLHARIPVSQNDRPIAEDQIDVSIRIDVPNFGAFRGPEVQRVRRSESRIGTDSGRNDAAGSIEMSLGFRDGAIHRCIPLVSSRSERGEWWSSYSAWKKSRLSPTARAR